MHANERGFCFCCCLSQWIDVEIFLVLLLRILFVFVVLEIKEIKLLFHELLCNFFVDVFVVGLQIGL